MASVRDNTKFRCHGCGAIVDIPQPAPFYAKPCPVCGKIDYEAIPVTVVCDFCSQPTPGGCWVYDCEDFAVDYDAKLPLEVMQGGWAACDPCHELIEADDWAGLCDRAVLVHQPPISLKARPFVRHALTRLHGEFRLRKLPRAPHYEEVKR